MFHVIGGHSDEVDTCAAIAKVLSTCDSRRVDVKPIAGGDKSNEAVEVIITGK